MIVKLVPKRSARSSFANLVHYLTDSQDNPQRVVHVQSANLHNDDVEDALGRACALAEVAELQARNTRATEKTAHLMLSFREDLDIQQLHEIEERTVNMLGYAGHQRISVVHGDTDHCHLHIALNKVYASPREDGSERYLCKHIDFSKRKLAAIATALELDYGLVPDFHGHQQWNELTRAELTQELRQSWAQEVRAASTWQDILSLSATHGIALKASGKTGLRLAKDGTTLAASKLGKEFARGALEKRLGPLPTDLSTTPQGAEPRTPTTQTKPKTELSLAQRLKTQAGHELRAANSLQEIAAVAQANGARLLHRGGGLSFEDLANGEVTSASSVSNQLSLGRLRKRLGELDMESLRSPATELREAVVKRASDQAQHDHERRRRAIGWLVPKAARPSWFARSQATLKHDQQRVQSLHHTGRQLELAQQPAPERASSLALFRRYALRLRHPFPALVSHLDKQPTQPEKKPRHGQLHQASPLPTQPRAQQLAARAPTRGHSLHDVPSRSLVRGPAPGSVLLPTDAQRVLHEHPPQRTRGAVRRPDEQQPRAGHRGRRDVGHTR